MKKLTAMILCAGLMLGVTACGTGTTQTTQADTTQAGTTQAVGDAKTPAIVQTGDRKAIALKGENFSFTQGEMVYMFGIVYSNYVSYLSMFGVDTTKSLKEQSISEDMTWFDMIMTEASSYASQYLLFCEAARAAGIELSEDDKKQLEEQKKSLESRAAEAGQEVDAFLTQSFGTNITLEDVMSVTEKMYLSDRFYEQLSANYVFTDAQLAAEFDRTPELYTAIDYRYCELVVGEETGLDAGKAAAFAERFAQAADEADFDAIAREVILAGAKQEDIDAADSEDAFIEKALATRTVSADSYNEDDAFKVWAYGEEAAAGAIYVSEPAEDGSRQAYLLTALPYKTVSRTVDIRHILFKSTTYGSLESAHAKAKEIYDAWVADGAKEESFIELCKEHSEDGNAQTGGIYENVTPGQMVETFNDWIFEEGRVYGQHGIVDTDFGAHLMFFVEKHESEDWVAQVRDSLTSEAYRKDYERLEKAHPITPDEDVMNSVVW